MFVFGTPNKKESKIQTSTMVIDRQQMSAEPCIEKPSGNINMRQLPEIVSNSHALL